tara:strand:- start:404 stop:610 length:207 start_codon:yes stop_codon:yes gene_type:complete
MLTSAMIASRASVAVTIIGGADGAERWHGELAAGTAGDAAWGAACGGGGGGGGGERVRRGRLERWNVW